MIKQMQSQTIDIIFKILCLHFIICENVLNKLTKEKANGLLVKVAK